MNASIVANATTVMLARTVQRAQIAGTATTAKDAKIVSAA